MEWTAYLTVISGLLVIVLSLKVDRAGGKGEAKSVGTSLELQCPSCEKIHCTPRRASKLKCKGGITRGICNCCPVCAKVQGEDCGGEWDYLGKCDRGLYCKPDAVQRGDAQGSKPEGKCMKAPHQAGDQAVLSFCKPKCNPEYCREHPKAICAALENNDKKQDCQGDCQHTSCSACRFVNDEPDCIKCKKDDYRCMRKFAKCIKRTVCTRQKFPCKRLKKNELGKFRCMVPECLVN